MSSTHKSRAGVTQRADRGISRRSSGTQRRQVDRLTSPKRPAAAIGNRAMKRLLGNAVQRAPSDERQLLQHEDPSLSNLVGVKIPDRGGGRPMPVQLNKQLAPAFGRDLSFIRIHRYSQLLKNGPEAMTLGTDIHFRPGQFAPHTDSGQRLVAHEVTHVIQQLSDRVEVPRGPGLPLNSALKLEQEADRLGRRARLGIPVTVFGSRSPMRRPVNLVGQQSDSDAR